MFVASKLNVSTALIKPNVPIDNKSSLSILVDSYFFTICATSLKLCSINLFLASKSLFCHNSKYFLSSSLVNTSGKFWELIAPRRGRNKKVKSSIKIPPNIINSYT